VRHLRRPAGPRFLLDELTAVSDASEQALRQAISDIAQSDPITKLLQEVKLGRMKPTDPGLRAITESWLGTYKKILEATRLNRPAVLRLDPLPRLEVLVVAGVLPADHAGAAALRSAFEKALSEAART
jgi:hypothetical protein